MLTRVILGVIISLASVLSFASTDLSAYLKVEKVDDEFIKISLCSKQLENLNCLESYKITKQTYNDLTKTRTPYDAFNDGAIDAAKIATSPVSLSFTYADAPFSVLYDTLMIFTIPVGILSLFFLLPYQYGKLGAEMLTEVYKLQTRMYGFVEGTEKSHVYTASPKAIELIFSEIKIRGIKIFHD